MMFIDSKTRFRWWFIYGLVGIGLGLILEILAATIPLWQYESWWMGMLVVVLAFGFGPATLALILRKYPPYMLFLAATILDFLIEGGNALLGWDDGWEHLGAFPLIDDPFWWTVVVSLVGGGLYVLLVNVVTSAIYQLTRRNDTGRYTGNFHLYQKYGKEDKYTGIEQTYAQLGKIDDPNAVPDPFEEVETLLQESTAYQNDTAQFLQTLNPDGKKLILSIDGGGTKGYIVLHVLAELERRTGKRCGDIFDFIAGTSTGSIITAAFAKGTSAQQLLMIYRSQIPKVFATAWNPLGGIAKLLLDLITPRKPEKIEGRNILWKMSRIANTGVRWAYSHSKLWLLCSRLMVTAQGGTQRLLAFKDIKKRLLITIKDVRRGETIFVTNAGPGKKAFNDLPVAYAIMGSSTAPIYLEPFNFWIDGGVGTYQNPCYETTLVATQVMQGNISHIVYPPEDRDPDDADFTEDNVILFSFGTGVALNVPVTERWQAKDGQEEKEGKVQKEVERKAKKKSVFQWLFYVISEGQEDGSDDQVRNTQEHFARGGRMDFRRFQITLDPEILIEEVKDGGIGLKLLAETEKRTKEEVKREEYLIKKLELDAHNLEQLRIMENLGNAWARALFTDLGDGKGIGICRPQYPYVDPFSQPSSTGADQVYWPPATPPGLVPAYLNKVAANIGKALLDYRNNRLPRMYDKADIPGYISQLKRRFEEDNYTA